MDALDRSIVALLQEDGRIRYTEIAKALDVTEGTVRNRVAKLLENQTIQIIGVLDPHRMGYNAPAIIGVSIQPPLLEEAAAEIASMPEVSYLIMVAGEYDLIVEVFCRDREHLTAFLKDRLLQVAGVQRAQTSFILHTYKVAHGAKTVLTRSLAAADG
ncbi:MAG TPA: Lrp/AsnC family transcriptional regulator [Anaerolineae bacterium]|jgi:Lrp/AsnC family transcriptional regulator for asnA, asnC and gidA|nr:Lrp/AsnC family transcriptional regulator [Anaerolineae bacterium]